ncbi:MAG: serine hydrolase [Candidatus Saccharimonadales bacterium]
MITPQAPPNIPIDSPNASIIERMTDPEVTNMLQNDHATDFIKKLILGYYVNKTIQKNEEQRVVTGVQIIDMQSGRPIISHNADEQHFAASINKLPVVLLILEDLRAGRLTMDQTLTWTTTDVRAGAGVYDQPGAPMQAKVKDVIFDLLNRSGNTAVRVLVNQGLGGAAAVNERWSHIPELSNTRLQPLDANRFYVGNSTARDSMWVMGKLMERQDSYAKSIKAAMKDNIYSDISVRSQLAGNNYITLVNKVGLLDDPEGNNRHDTGIIYNTKTKKSYGYSLFTTSPSEDAEATSLAEQSLKDMGRYTLRFSGDKKVKEGVGLRATDVLQKESRILY